MKLFVTGATGKVGSRFVPYLLSQGHTARILVRDAGRASQLKNLGAELVEGDLVNNENLTEAIRGADAVVHIAAQFRGGVSAEMAQAVNVDGTVALAQAALAAGVSRFVFTSTGRVYEGNELGRPALETDVLRMADTVYPRTKLSSEEALLSLHREQDLDVRIMRLPFVYGAGDPHITEVLPYMRNWHPAKLMSVGHHHDVSQALLLAATTPGIGGRRYNVADDYPVRVGELYLISGEAEPTATEGELSDIELYDMVMDTGRIKSELNFQPKYPSLYTAKELGAL